MRVPTRAYGWYVLGLLASANFLHYANRNVVVTMYDDLRSAFSFSNAELGLLSTAFMATHAAGTLGFGWLADRRDRRAVMAFGLIAWSGGAVLGAYAFGLGSMLLSRALVGLGTAACVPVANAFLCDVFPRASKARSVAVFNLGLFVGGLAGVVLGTVAGFPLAFLVVGVPGFFVAAAVARLRIGGRPAPSAATVSADLALAGAASVLANRTFRWTVLAASLMAFAAGGYLAWFYDFLVNVKRAAEGQAVGLLVVALVAGLFGVLTGGALGDRLARRVAWGRQAAMAIGFAVSAPLAIAVLYVPLGAAFYAASALLMFFISWYHGPLAASVDDLVPPHRAATAQGLYIACMHLFGTAPSSYLVGELADRVGLRTALLVPTAAMLLAALATAASFRGLARDSVVQRAR